MGVQLLGGPPAGVPRPTGFVLPLIDSRRESPTAMTFRFSTRDTDFRYRSNQAIRLALPGVDDPWGPVRTFSLSSSPSELGHIAVTCKISDTPFKQALARLRPGESAEVYGPLGLFLFDSSRPSVFLAGGIGITPFRGMLRFAADGGVTQERRLLYSARTPEELVFRLELDELSRPPSPLRVTYSVTRPSDSTDPWSGRVGRIDLTWVREATRGLHEPLYYVAGLPAMVEDLVSMLRGPLGVRPEDIDFEVFRGF